MHTCRTWRRIVFESQQALHLRLFCTHGSPVLKSLDFWPALPIVVQYGGSLELDPPTPEDEVYIMAAIKHSDRVISISLTLTSSLQAKLSTIKSPFSALEDLVLVSQNRMEYPFQPRLVLWWGARLRRLHLTRIAVLELPRLLHSSKNLVDLQLHEVLYPLDFPAETLTNAFSGMTQLRSFSLHFTPYSYSNRFAEFLPSRKLVALPSLTRFDFQGNASVVKAFVAGVDAPLLGDINVTFLDHSVTDISDESDESDPFDLSVLIDFINRIKIHKSPRRADILSFEDDITISLTQPGVHTRIRWEFYGAPPSTMARICIQFSAFLFNVEDLRIHGKQPSPRNDGPYNERWLPETVHLFIGVKWLQVSGNLSCDFVNFLQRRHWRRESVLPALHKIHVLQPGPCHASMREAIESLLASRRLSGHHIAVEYENILHFNNEIRATGTAHSH